MIKKEYERLKSDPNYTDVAFNPANGGLKATHKEHSFDPSPSPFGINMQRGDYEKKSRDILFENGHKVILQSERTEDKLKVSDGFLDDKKFDIKGIETLNNRNIKDKLFAASKQDAETIVLYYPNAQVFSSAELKKQVDAYYRISTKKNIKYIYYIIDNQLHKHI
ncbi:hypothetical protein AGMMS49965_03100 [Bacteroidia bacterium]|nr:hypothetical protein AGMMS49965_03100 [Bacteroidia bacterium]